MPLSPRFWVSLVRSLASGLCAGVRRSAVPLAVTVVVGVVLAPSGWQERASAAQDAKAVVRPHELVGLRDARSTTRLTADGSLVTRLSRQSVHWFDREVGVWREIDTGLSVSAKAGVGWVSGSNRFTVEVADQTREGQQALVLIKGRAGELGIALEDATAGKQGVESADNQVAFRGVQPSVDLEYVVLPDGVKENIILRDSRDRLVQETSGTGVTTTFALDVVGNVTAESPSGGAATSRSYNAQQLASETSAGTTVRFLYDAYGNQDCKVKSSYAGSACPGSGSDLLEDWLFDYKNRLAGYRSYNGSGGLVTRVDYVNDPLDRPVSQATTASGSTTNYAFRYVGASDLLSTETLTGATSATRRYAYDVFGRRATIADGASRYSYLHDPHGSVSLLLDQNGVAKASYGYGAYGSPNSALTRTAAGFNAAANAYRYTGKRLDAGSATLDMGARRYTPASGRFLQADRYPDALANLGLSLNPLASNRYALAAGNPVNYVELDGHMVAAAEGDLNPGDRAWVQQQLRSQIAQEAAAACHTTDRCTSDKQKTIEVVETASVFLPLPLPNKLRAALKGTSKLWKWARPSTKAAKPADEALPTITALTRQQDAALSAVMRDPNKLRHIFGKPQHNLGPVTKELGGQEALIREAVLAVPRGTTGTFAITTRIGRYDLTVRGRVVNGVPRIGTVFVR